jgi:GcrA cell cycle regulator
MPVSVAEGFCLEGAMAGAGLTWTEERIELLTKLWTEGLSASQIAAELGGDVSRNAVLGKANRLGLTHGSSKVASTPHTRKPSRQPEPSSTSETSGQSDLRLALTLVRPHVAGEPEEILPREDAPVPDQAAEETRPEVDGAVPLSRRVTIMELREGVCRWPLGDPAHVGFGYCGAQAVTGLPYCAHHAQVAYQPAAERKRLRA